MAKLTRTQKFKVKQTKTSNKQQLKVLNAKRKIAREKASTGKIAVREAGQTIRSVAAQALTPRTISQVQAGRKDNASAALGDYLSLIGGSVDNGGSPGSTQKGSTTEMGSVGGG